MELEHIPEDVFELLIDLSSINSIKVINAMRDYLVLGDSQQQVCQRYNVNMGYFYIALGGLSRINHLVLKLAPYYK